MFLHNIRIHYKEEPPPKKKKKKKKNKKNTDSHLVFKYLKIRPIRCCIEKISKTVKNINAHKEMIHHKQKNLFTNEVLASWITEYKMYGGGGGGSWRGPVWI